MQLQQQMQIPNYPPVERGTFATQVSYPTIDQTTLWPVGHKSEPAARRYAAELSDRADVEVAVFGVNGETLDTYKQGEPV